MEPDIAKRRKVLAADRVAAVIVVGFVAMICWATWAFSPRSGTAVIGMDAPIRWIGPGNSRSANSRGVPQTVLEIETEMGSDSARAATHVWS